MDRLCSRCNYYMRKDNDVNSTLREAIEFGHGDCVQFLLEEGADVNKLERVNTPLMLTAMCKKRTCAYELIKAGADVNKPNKNGDTALICAAQAENVHCLLLLIESGADVNRQCNKGDTALISAARHGRSESVELLIQVGADVKNVNSCGHNALIQSALSGSPECIRLLIEAGTDVNVADKDNRTALFSSVVGYNCDIACVKLLLEAGSKINIVDILNHNALQHHILKSFNAWKPNSLDKGICMLLLAAGETIDGTTIKGRDDYGLPVQVFVPDFLLNEDLKLNLKHSCRKAVRKHLINIDPHQHLFYRVPKLRLPSLLSAYLLYDESVGEPITFTTKPATKATPKALVQVTSGAEPAGQVTSGTKPAAQVTSGAKPAAQVTSGAEPAGQATSAAEPAVQVTSRAKPATQVGRRSKRCIIA